MDTDPETVTPDTDVEEVIARAARATSCPASRWSTTAAGCVGIVTEADLVLPDDDGDLHLPHYVNIFGGTVFLEPLKQLRGAGCARRSPPRPRT